MAKLPSLTLCPQVWSLVPVLAKLVITTIVPMFTLSEQMYEEPLVLTITQATELIRLNSRILHNLETIEVMDSFKSKHIFFIFRSQH